MFTRNILALIAVLASSQALAQHTFNRDDGTFSAPATTDVTFTATGSGAIQRMIDAHIKDGPISVKDFGASGSSTSTTGTISAGSATLTLAGAIDFVNGQGVRVNHAGAAYALNPPTGLGVANVGTPGTTTYTYTVSCFDNSGGIDAALTTVATTTGNATLNTTNYNTVSWTAPTGTAPAGCAVWGNIAGSLSLRALLPGTFHGAPVVSWDDHGYAATTAPDWLGSTPPATQAADWLVTTINAGGGTTTLTLAATATTAATAQLAAHDDTSAITHAIGSVWPAGGHVYIPKGTYNTSDRIAIGSAPNKITGAGWGNTFINPVSPSSDVLWQGSGSPGLTNISDINISSAFMRTGGAGINALGGPNMTIDNIHMYRMFNGMSLSNNGVRVTNANIRNTAPTYGVVLLYPAANDQYFVGVIADSTDPQPRACIEVTQNGGLLGLNSDFIHCGTGMLIDPQNGQSVKWIFFSGVAFDTSSGDGIYINPAAGGEVVGAFFTDSWTASMQGHGVHLGSTGTISETSFSSHRSQNNQKHCYFVEGGEISVVGSVGTHCSLAGSGLYDGFAATNADNISLVGNRFGKVSGVLYNNQKYGIEFISGGTVTLANIVANDVSYNVTGGMNFAGTISAQQQMVGNVPSTGETNINFGGTFQGPKMASNVLVSTGALPTPTGTCAIATQTGGTSAGTFTASGACAGGTVVLTFATTVSHGFSCTAHNRTTPANLMNQTATTTASVTFTGTMANADVVSFSCIGY